jgi:ApaG protein
VYYQITDGIRVTVYPAYIPAQSQPHAGRYVFSYRVRIENVRSDTVQLVWRDWFIHDPVAGDQGVSGEGVVGLKPVLPPGAVHEYKSFCILEGPEGFMEGRYEFTQPGGGDRLHAKIPRFYLRAGAQPA